MHSTSTLFGKESLSRIAGLLKVLVWIFNRPMITQFPLATKTIPKGVYGRIAPRSGLAAKHMIDIGAGVIDPDYTGEVKVVIFNHSSNDFIIKEGDKIAQLILERVSILEPIICVQKPHTSGRGGQGFGSTDKGAPAASATFPSHMWSSTGSTEWFAMPRGSVPVSHALCLERRQSSIPRPSPP